MPAIARIATTLCSVGAVWLLFAPHSSAQQIDTRILKPSIIEKDLRRVELATRSISLNYALQPRAVTVQFVQAASRQGSVRVHETQWNCRGSACTSTIVGVPQVPLCKGIVQAQQQAARSFGDASVKLAAEQLAECNSVVGGLSLSTTMFVAPALIMEQTVEPGQPGPNGVKENLLNQFGDRFGDAQGDFLTAVGWFHEIYQDGAEPHVWYYLPAEYRLQLLNEGERPLALSFNHTYESAAAGDKTVLMTATFTPPATNGDIALMEALANSALSLSGGATIRLRAFPVDSVELQLVEGLVGFGILPEDVQVTSMPRDVREPLSIRIRMTEIAQTELLTLLREREGIGGNVVIRSGTAYAVPVPIYLSLHRVSGHPLPAVSRVGETGILANASFVPVTLRGIVGYVRTSGTGIERRYRALTNEPILQPRQQQQLPPVVASGLAQSFGATGVVHSWFDYRADMDCRECLTAVERLAESQVSLLRRNAMTIEIPEFVFADLGAFKVGVQVRSRSFDSSGTVDEIRDYELRPGETIAREVFYLDRARGADDEIGNFRVRVFREDGSRADWSDWRAFDSTALTLVTADFQHPK